MFKLRRWAQVLIVFLLLTSISASAQGGAPLIAFVNSSNQLVVSSADGAYRWIVTNPGETLLDPPGYHWSADGRQLFFAIRDGAEASLRIADAGSQTVREIGRTAETITGGGWAGGSMILASGSRIARYPADGSGAVDALVQDGGLSFFVSGARPHLQDERSLSPDGRYALYLIASNRNYAAAALDGSATTVVPLTNEPNAVQSGLWADNAPLVAFWGYGATSNLAVANAATGATLLLDSGRSVPITPLAWRPGTTQLIYRDAGGFARIADVGCLLSGCADNPLQSGGELLPASAADVQTDGTWVYYRDGEQIQALNLGCVGSNNCLSSAVALGANAAPGTIMHVSGGRLAYTAYASDPNNPADRQVSVVDLVCLGNPATCSATPVLSGATAGLVSPDGRYVVVEMAAGGLNVLDITSGATAYLSDAGARLLSARWG